LTNMINHVTLSSYYFGVCFSDNADKIMNRLGLARHYPMLHMMTHFDNNHRPRLNNLESMHGKIVNIPIHQHLTEKEVVEIVRIIGE
jgi:dTDP-4-amino-4,6-dideoxygalactose transaminase